MSEKERRGRCLCGSVEFVVTGEPVIVAHCHCEDCQRLTGAGHSTGAMYASDKVQMTGEIGEYKLQSENGNEVTRVFCPRCGSPVFGRNTAMEGFQTFSLGLFEDSSDLVPEVTVFARNRNPWDVMDDKIQTFEAQPVWDPNAT
ncbi:MAG: GFA family protein [Sneathiella sp.]